MTDSEALELQACLDLASVLNGIADQRRRRVERILASQRLTPADWLVVQVLADEGVRLTPSAISDLTDLPRSTISGVLLRLESHGVCARYPDRRDGRRWLLALTEQGARHVTRLRSVIEMDQARQLQSLTSEQVRYVTGVLAPLAIAERELQPAES